MRTRWSNGAHGPPGRRRCVRPNGCRTAAVSVATRQRAQASGLFTSRSQLLPGAAGPMRENKSAIKGSRWSLAVPGCNANRDSCQAVRRPGRNAPVAGSRLAATSCRAGDMPGGGRSLPEARGRGQAAARGSLRVVRSSQTPHTTLPETIKTPDLSARLGTVGEGRHATLAM